MALVDNIDAIINRRDLDEDGKRRQIYDLKVTALVDVINDSKFIGRTIEREGFTFCINSARATEQPALALDVTFTRPSANPVMHQIIITNPPILPRNKTGNEREDLIATISEMLEGFV